MVNKTWKLKKKNVLSQIVKYHLDYITCKIGKQIGLEALCRYSAGHLQTSEFKLVEYYTWCDEGSYYIWLILK